MARYICASPQDSFEYNPVEYNTVVNGISTAMSSTAAVGSDDLDIKPTDSSARATSRRRRSKDQSPEVVLVCSKSSLILFLSPSPLCNVSFVSNKTSYEQAVEGSCKAVKTYQYPPNDAKQYIHATHKGFPTIEASVPRSTSSTVVRPCLRLVLLASI
jgi:hypothetical protein